MGKARPANVRVAGPLARYAPGFRDELASLGYASPSAVTHLLLMAQLSRWLEGAGLDAGDLTSDRIDEFRAANREVGHRFPRSRRGMMLLLSHLRSQDAAPAATMAVLSGADQVLQQFRLYLSRERG